MVHLFAAYVFDARATVLQVRDGIRLAHSTEQLSDEAESRQEELPDQVPA